MNIGHELLVVEGRSAATSIELVCRPNQHVIAVQGKPLNVERASDATIRANERVNLLYRHIVGSPSASFSPDHIHFERVLLLTDANVDGVHTKALLLLLMAKVMPEVIDDGRLFTVRSPVFGITCAERTQPVFAYSDEGRQSVLSQLAARGATNLATQHYAGLAGMGAGDLVRAFTDPATRQLTALTQQQVTAARAALQ